MKDKWQGIVSSLNREKEAVEKRLAKIEKDRSAAKASIRSLEVALSALREKSQTSSPPRRSAPTTADAIEIATEILSSSSSIAMDELLKSVGEKLSLIGKSRVGLKLRLEQALRDERFVHTDSGYELHIDESANASANVNEEPR